CDMYRQTIEHPDYLPAEVRKRTDFDAGRDLGRIWRVRAAQAPTGKTSLSLARATPRQLVRSLGDANGWRRDTAFRLLLERHEKSAMSPLRSALKNSSAPAATVLRLRLLDLFGGLDDRELLEALRHRQAPVRETALQLAETRLGRPR